MPSGISPQNYYGRMVEVETDNCQLPFGGANMITDEWFSYDADGNVVDMRELTPHSGMYYHSHATFAGNRAPLTVQLENPISGSGTVTNNYGSTWSYTYSGTVTTTTITTTETNLPYTDTTIGLYANAYNESGTAVAWAQRAVSYRQGGDGMNTLGYNLGSRLGSIHVKEHLLNAVMERLR